MFTILKSHAIWHPFQIIPGSDFINHNKKFKPVLDEMLNSINTTEFKKVILNNAAEHNDSLTALDYVDAIGPNPKIDLINQGITAYINKVNELDVIHLNSAKHYTMLTESITSICLTVKSNINWKNEFIPNSTETIQEVLHTKLFTQLTDKFVDTIGTGNCATVCELHNIVLSGNEMAMALAMVPKIFFVVGGISIVPHLSNVLDPGWMIKFLKQSKQKICLMTNGPMVLNRSDSLRSNWFPLSLGALGITAVGSVAGAIYFQGGKTRVLTIDYDMYKGVADCDKKSIIEWRELSSTAGLYMGSIFAGFYDGMRRPFIGTTVSTLSAINDAINRTKN